MSGQTDCGGKVSVSSCISERPRTTLNLIPVRLKDEDEDKTVDALAAVYIKKITISIENRKKPCVFNREGKLLKQSQGK